MTAATATTRRQTAPQQPAKAPAGTARRPAVRLIHIAAVLGAFAIAGLSYWAYQTFTKDMPEAERASDRFLELLKVGDLDDEYDAKAYAATSSQFRAQHSAESFREFARLIAPALREATRDRDGISVSTTTAGKLAAVEYTLRSGPRKRACTVELLNEGGEWKVTKIQVGPVKG